MPNLSLQEQAAFQSIYMNYLLTKAKQAAALKQPPSFDPQGRLLVDVTLTAQDYANIAQEANDMPRGNFIVDSTPEAIQMALGRHGKPSSPTTTVSLDAQEGLKDQFHQQLKGALVRSGLGSPESCNAVIAKLEEQPKGSIIALQQEMHFHLGLASRVYQDKIPEKKGAIEESHQAAMARVNVLVMDAYAKALKKASNNGTTELSLSDLNKALDKAREEIAPQAHVFLVEEMARRGIKRDEIRQSNYKKLTEGTTATPNDVLHLDPDLGIATLIEGSDNTAHHRVKGGAHLATRQIMTQNYTDFGINASENPRIQIRTPSIDEKKKLSERDSIKDIKDKLKFIAAKHDFSEALEEALGKKPVAFVYNLHTALEHWAGDRGGNLQSQGATRILQGAHQYNAEQLNSVTPPVFCFVQNISVNGFGKSLSERNNYPLVKEAALMSELAMLHTLYNSAPDKVKPKIEGVFKKYEAYLYEAYLNDPSPKKPIYFSQSRQGNDSLLDIGLIKTSLQELQDPVTPDETIPPGRRDAVQTKEQITRALQLVFANNLHEDHQYSKLTQALAIYAEEGSIAGCKSGNERAQAVNGRVAILDAAARGKLGQEGHAIRQALAELSTGQNAPEKMATLKNAIDVAYNKYALQGAASMISLLDQGAAAKVEARNGPTVGTFESTNHAEEPGSVMTNLQQSKAGKMQAHKGAPESMAAAVDQVHGRSFGQFMKDTFFSSIGKGIAFATILLPITIIGALVGLGKQIDTSIKAGKNEQVHQQFVKAEQERVVPREQEQPRERVQRDREVSVEIGPRVQVAPRQDYHNTPPLPSSRDLSSKPLRDTSDLSRQSAASLRSLKASTLETPLLSDCDDQNENQQPNISGKTL